MSQQNYALISDTELLNTFYNQGSPEAFRRFEYTVVFVNDFGHVDVKVILAHTAVDAKKKSQEFAIRLKRGSWKVQSVKRNFDTKVKW